MSHYGTSCGHVRADRGPSKSPVSTVAIPADSVNKRALPQPALDHTERVSTRLECWRVSDYGDLTFRAD